MPDGKTIKVKVSLKNNGKVQPDIICCDKYFIYFCNDIY